MEKLSGSTMWHPRRRWFRRWSFWLVFVILAIASITLLARAAPLPPRWVVNHQTLQCAQITPGDECGDVVLPPGWEYLDREECPAGYQQVDLRPEWVHFKVAHCCTEGHSGVSGDCEDVVIQSQARQCAFVEDIRACASLPDGWASLRKDCPQDFTWVADLACSAEMGQSGGREAGAVAGPSSATIQPVPSETAGGTSPAHTVGVCRSIAPLGLLLFVMIVRQRRSDLLP